MKPIRLAAIGFLTGILLGLFVSFLMPDLLNFGAQIQGSTKEQLGMPNYSPSSGSVLNSLMLFPLVLGLIGGLVGYLLAKFLHKS